jgi:hypothetical protein
VRGVAVPGRGAEQRAAATRDRKRPHAARCTRLVLQLGEERRRRVLLTECQQGLDRIAVEAKQRRLAELRFGNRAGKRAEKAMGFASLAQRVFDGLPRFAAAQSLGRVPEASFRPDARLSRARDGGSMVATPPRWAAAEASCLESRIMNSGAGGPDAPFPVV